MPVLHVEEVPADLYERIERRAAAQRRDVNGEVIHLLQQALVEEETARAAHMAALAALRQSRQTVSAGGPSSVELLREDRER